MEAARLLRGLLQDRICDPALRVDKNMLASDDEVSRDKRERDKVQRRYHLKSRIDREICGR